MTKKLAYERYIWFHQKLKKQLYPSIKDLMERFELSQRQASREIQYMRDFFGAPIIYSPEKRGYCYEDENFELPGIWLSEEEIISLIISKRISSAIPNKDSRTRIDAFFDKLYRCIDVDISALEEKISIKNTRYYRVKPEIFEAVVFGISRSRRLKIHYRTPYGGEQSVRTIQPLHMLLYMGNWHLIAFCDKRNAIRDFVLSRIMDVEITATDNDKSHKSKDIHKLVKESYGIFFEGDPKEVVLEFSGDTAGMIADQVWYPGQSTTVTDDGNLLLRFPVSDLREVTWDILRFGSAVKVIEPFELKEKIRNIAEEMIRKYQ